MKKSFLDMINESESGMIIDKEYTTQILGSLHKKLSEEKSNDVVLSLVEMLIANSVHNDLPNDMHDMISIICEDVDMDDEWHIGDTYELSESSPWCFDEDGVIIEDEFVDIMESLENEDDEFEEKDKDCDVDGDGTPDELLQQASKKSLNKSMSNIKSAATFTTKKNFDKFAGVTKKQKRAGMVRCPPGTPGEGKIRIKGSCKNKIDKKLSKALKKAAKSNKSGRKLAAKKAARTRKKLGGRKREE